MFWLIDDRLAAYVSRGAVHFPAPGCIRGAGREAVNLPHNQLWMLAGTGWGGGAILPIKPGAVRSRAFLLGHFDPTGLLAGGDGETRPRQMFWLCCGTGNRTDMWRSGIQRSRCCRPAAITICTDEIRDLRVGRLLSPEAKHKNPQNKSMLGQR